MTEVIYKLKLLFKIWKIVHRLDIAGLWFALELLDGVGKNGQQDIDYEAVKRR